MRMFRLLVVLLGATLVASACGGCSCTPLEPSLAFDDLPDTVDCADTPDADTATVGYQFEVQVQLTDAEESGFTTVEVARTGGGTVEGTFDDTGLATLTVTLATSDVAAGATNTLTATAVAANGESYTATGTVNVVCGEEPPPPEPECHFTAPQDGATLSSSPVSVSVSCSGGDPDDAAVQALLTDGEVVVTSTPDGGGSTSSVQLNLTGGVATGNLAIPNADGATLDLVLSDPSDVLADAVTDSIHVDIEVTGLAVTNILVVAAGTDDVLNIADNGGTAATGDVSSNVTVTLNEAATGTFTGTTTSGTCTGSASGTSVTLSGCDFPQGSSAVVVTASGLSTVGNSKTILVDTVAPTASITSPADGATLTGVDDIADPGFRAAVVVASTDNGATVTVNVDGTAAGTGTVASGTVSVTTPLDQGARALTIDIVDGAGNATDDADTATVTVDSVAPVLVLVAAASVSSTDDIGGDSTDGIQVDVTVTPTGLTTGRTITVSSDVQGVIGTCLSAGDGVGVACRVTYLADDVHAVSASATDEAGNLGTSNVIDVDADTGLYFVDIDNPPLRGGLRSIGAAEDEDTGTTGAQVTVTGTTTAPVGSVVALLLDGVEADASTVAAGGAITLGPVTFADGDSGDFEVVVTEASVVIGTSGVETFRVDLGRPTVDITTPAGSSATFAQAQDLSTDPGLQVNVTVAVSECEDGVITVRDGSTVIGTNDTVVAGGSGSYVVAVTDLTEGDGETWTATCVDAEGNTPAADDTLTATVDITAPAAPTIGVTVVDVRSGDITISYTQPGDDANSGSPTTVELFLNKNVAITEGTFGNPGQIAVTVPGSGTAGGTAVGPIAAADLPFDNTWHMALRATDDVGNAALSFAQANVATGELVLSPPTSVAGWAEALSRSRRDINGDGFDDIVIGAPNGGSGDPGGFEVILGAATAAGITRTFVPAPATMACLAPPCNTEEAGWAVNILPSLNGDAYDDVVVVAYDQRGGPLGAAGSPEFLLIYQGTSTGIAASATPDGVLELSAAAFPAYAGYSAEGVGDVDNDGNEDWAFSAPYLASVYLFLNDAAIPTGTAEAAATTIITNSDGAYSFYFGASQTGAGKNGDDFDDLIIACQDVPSLFVVRGRASWPATLDTAGTTGNDYVALAQPATVFPAWDLSAGDVDGDGNVDLAYVANTSINVVRGTGSTWAGETAFAVSLPIYIMGNGLIVPSVNGDARADLLVGGWSLASLYFGDATIATKSADTSYPITTAGGTDWLMFKAANVVGSSADPDIVVLDSTDDGTVTIRY